MDGDGFDPLNPFSLDSHIKYYPPPPRENFFGPRFGYKNVLDCKSFGNCSLYVATKCTNLSLHLFRSQRVIYTELSLSIKKEGRVF